MEKEAKVADESSFAGTVTTVVIIRKTALNVEMQNQPSLRVLVHGAAATTGHILATLLRNAALRACV